MTTMKANANQNETTTSKTPTHFAYQVRSREGKKSIWTRIGSAWAHGDGSGFNIQLDAVPIDGKITLRVPTESEEQASPASGAGMGARQFSRTAAHSGNSRGR
jgi:hypothetical protein